MDDLSINFLYLRTQYIALDTREKQIDVELLKKPQHALLTAELQRVKHDKHIIGSLLTNLQNKLLDTLETELNVEFQWLRKKAKKDNGIQVGK